MPLRGILTVLLHRGQRALTGPSPTRGVLVDLRNEVGIRGAR